MDWHPFPHDSGPFTFEGARLRECWKDLHRGDLVPYPDEDWIRDTLERVPQAAGEDFNGDLSLLSKSLLEAWRCFHAGEFGAAVERAHDIGPLGHAVANKAAGIYATYLEPDAKRQRDLFMAAAQRAEKAIEVLPDDPNAHYFLAFNLGRYSQSISIVDALRRGIGGKIQAALQRTLEIAPEHAEAHTAFGMYHAEIIDKVGKMIGGMTYGASASDALEHFETAIELTPDAPIAHIEYGNGLYLLYGDKRLEEVTDLYVRASEMEPRDAMEKLDIEAALAELE